MHRTLAAALILFIAAPSLAQTSGAPVSPTIPSLARSVSAQKQDASYTAKIREYTTEPFFLTELVDHLPASDRVPTPEKFHSYIAGAPGKLTYAADVHRYFRALEKASPRVKVFTMGRSEEGREMILAAVGDESNLKRLGRLKEITGKLADPRKTTDPEAEKLILEGKVFYYLTGAIHSPETGSPEMLMELAYRLAVEETPFIQAIRKNVVTLITPVLEVDGRERVVDIHRYRQANPGKPVPNLVFWGKYVAHDNNRDGMALSLELSKAVMRTFLEYHPAVLHDLHESVPFLYTSTGTGPYNAWLDPIVIGEWHQLAYHEINEMTRRGMPGVWTHGFYDGWAPNYMFYAANGHNSIGRFYETFGNGRPETQDRTVGSQSQREWFRPNPPLARVKWSLRNNVNYQQSGVLFALKYSADHKDEMLHNFWLKSKRSVAKAANEGPAAYILPGDEPRKGNQAELVSQLRLHGIEVHRADSEISVKEGQFPAGSYVVRMDQPYSRLADMLLDVQYYRPDDPRPYDDTGWTLGPLKNVRTVRILDPSILSVSMSLPGDDARPANIPRTTAAANALTSTQQALRPRSYIRRNPAPAPNAPAPLGYAVMNNADCSLASWRYRLKDVNMLAAAETFQSGDRTFPPGTFVIPTEGNPPDLVSRLELAGKDSGISVIELPALPAIKTHPVAVPRIAILHTWQSTQNDGWFRLAFDQWKVPYDYVSVHTIRDTGELKSKWDVIVFPTGASSGSSFRNGVTGSEPVPWKKTELTPNLGGPDSSDDIRGGAGDSGVANLRKFLNDGGVFIAVQSTTNVAIDLGLAPGVTTASIPSFQSRGAIFRAVTTAPNHPVMYGYQPDPAVYFSSSPLFKIEGEPEPQITTQRQTAAGQRQPTGRPSGRGSLTDPDIPQGRPAYTPPPGAARDDGRRQADGEPRRESDGGNPSPATTAPSTPNDTATPRPSDPPVQFGKPRAILRFAELKDLLVSGMLAGGEALAGRAAVIDIPAGKGHVLLFAINPMWRMQTQGSYPLIFNAVLHFAHLDVAQPVTEAQNP